MEIEFLGVGEAFEPQLGNNSLLVHSATKLLVDCGYGVPARYFQRGFEPDFLDAVYITHFHADHVFGLPALLTRALEDRRTKPLRIIGQPGLEHYLTKLIDMAYSSTRARLPFQLEWIETHAALSLNELQLEFAESIHSVRNFAVRITCGRSVLGVSGDGEITPATRELFAPCTVLAHEAFRPQGHEKNHSSAAEICSMALECPALNVVAFTHLQRAERAAHLDDYRKLGTGKPWKVLIPEPGEKLSL